MVGQVRCDLFCISSMKNLQQRWYTHVILSDSRKINQRLDAVLLHQVNIAYPRSIKSISTILVLLK